MLENTKNVTLKFINVSENFTVDKVKSSGDAKKKQSQIKKKSRNKQTQPKTNAYMTTV
jgi:hypothetical protein